MFQKIIKNHRTYHISKNHFQMDAYLLTINTKTSCKLPTCWSSQCVLCIFLHKLRHLHKKRVGSIFKQFSTHISSKVICVHFISTRIRRITQLIVPRKCHLADWQVSQWQWPNFLGGLQLEWRNLCRKKNKTVIQLSCPGNFCGLFRDRRM